MKITLLTGQTFDFKNIFGFEIKIKKSPLAKKLTLRIDEKKRLPTLTIPKRCSEKQALEFLKANQDWITNTLAKLPVKIKFYDGENISFFGRNYTIVHAPNQKGSCFEGNTIKISGNIEFLHRRVSDFLKKQTLDSLSELSLQKASSIGCKISSITIKDTKSRWGSCSTLGNINYNWRICFAPIDVINYLVCHEVSHLKHPNHSTSFWKTVEELCPNHKECRKWLKIKGKDLYKYF